MWVFASNDPDWFWSPNTLRNPFTISLCFSVSHDPLSNVDLEAELSFTAQSSLKVNLHYKRFPLFDPTNQINKGFRIHQVSIQNPKWQKYCGVGSKVAFQISSQNWHLEYHVKEFQCVLNSNQWARIVCYFIFDWNVPLFWSVSCGGQAKQGLEKSNRFVRFF